MIFNVKVEPTFKAVPYLPTTKLMQRFKNGLHFSTIKPNVIVGPNGSGKSALLKALALRTLSWFTGVSTLDHRYMSSIDARAWWSDAPNWWGTPLWLCGLHVYGDIGPAVYYRPGLIPGDEVGITHAMMMGYDKEAREYAELTEHKSSGQANLACLKRAIDTVTGQRQAKLLRTTLSSTPKEKRADRFESVYSKQERVLNELYVQTTDNPVVLMDEPEQSLDALANIDMWDYLMCGDYKQSQLIVATHSLYPLLKYRDRIELIEPVPGYVDRILNRVEAH